MPGKEDAFSYALSSNAAWAGYKSHQNPSFFTHLASGQKPQILWIGCSDSRCPETTILGMQPGDLFVQRNVANIVSPTDINLLSVVEFAVGVVQVQHIVLCGHTACGGANAALRTGPAARLGGVLDLWITPLRTLRAAHADELAALPDDAARAVRLAELNVAAGVQVLLASAVVQDAIEQRGLQVHGTLYDLATGRIRDLACGTRAKHGPGGGAGASGHGPGDDTLVRGKHGMLVFRDDGASMAVQ